MASQPTPLKSAPDLMDKEGRLMKSVAAAADAAKTEQHQHEAMAAASGWTPGEGAGQHDD